MNGFSAPRWRRRLFLLGMVLALTGAGLYTLDRNRSHHTHLMQQANALYQAQQYREAITAYERVLAHTTTLVMRLTAALPGRGSSAAKVSLQIANCHYHLAETALRHYREAAGDPHAATPRPSLVAVQRLLHVAGKAYEDVPQTDPYAAMAAQVNGARVATWQLVLAAFDEQTTGRRSLRQQALRTIRQAASAVDYGHAHRARLPRHQRMTAMLLLETLTAFSRETPPPQPPRTSRDPLQGQLGDLLLQHTPELSAQERQRFQQFFFALPLEAKDPWPLPRQGGAGGGRRGVAH